MNDFGSVELLEAEAIGEPGNRTFRLRMRSGAQTASIWLEKEQLAALSLALREVLARVSGGDVEEPAQPPPLSSGFPDEPQVEFKASHLGLGYDERIRQLILIAYDDYTEPGSPPSFTCRATPEQSRALGDMADAAVAAGRPICFLCGSPIDASGHVCPRGNGHHELRPTT